MELAFTLNKLGWAPGALGWMKKPGRPAIRQTFPGWYP